MIPSERLKGIEAFVTATDAGSFTAAAKRMNLTNSAVGKGVARLEARLGTRLFDRTTRTLALTDAGEAFYATCVRVLAELADAEGVLAAQRSEPFGRLKIDVPVAFGRLQVLPLLLPFAEQNANLRPVITFTDRFTDVIDEGIDVAVRIGGLNVLPSGLGRRYLGDEKLIFCASSDYLAKRGLPKSADDFTDYDCILYGRGDGSTIPWRFADGSGSAVNRTMEGRIVLGSAEAQVAAVKAGFGVAQLATWLIKDELERGELTEMMPELATKGLPLSLVWPRSRQLSLKVDALLELLANGLRIE